MSLQPLKRLIELANSEARNTLDGVDLTGVQPPPTAVNLLDFECLASFVPGTEVARTRAWGDTDPRFPGLVAPGAITVVIVPGCRPIARCRRMG